jgi:KDO2-lipid IV(A) lauroyltransferase
LQPQRLPQFAVYVAVRLAICIVQALPLETCAQAARWLSWLMTDIVRLREKLIDDNLRHAYPNWSAAQRRQARRQVWEHLFLFVAEIAHTPRKIHDTNWRDYVRLTNVRQSVRLLLSQRPVVLVTAHHGNFELTGYILGILGFPTYTVARTLDNPYLDRFVNRFRGLTGQFIIPKKGGYDQILRILSGGGTLSFLADQYAGSKGCFVEFFGRPASVHKAIALLVLAHDASLIVGGGTRQEGPLRYELTIQAVFDPKTSNHDLHAVRPLTQWYTSQLETLIRRHPEQYWWLHDRWRDRRKKAARRQAA